MPKIIAIPNKLNSWLKTSKKENSNLDGLTGKFCIYRNSANSIQSLPELEQAVNTSLLIFDITITWISKLDNDSKNTKQKLQINIPPKYRCKSPQ